MTEVNYRDSEDYEDTDAPDAQVQRSIGVTQKAKRTTTPAKRTTGPLPVPGPKPAQEGGSEGSGPIPLAARRRESPAPVVAAAPVANQPTDLSEIDLQELIETNFPKRRWLDQPPDLSRAKAWLGWAGELVAAPFNWFLDAGTSPDVPVEDTEYVGWVKTNLYRLTGGLAFLFSAYISQAVTAHVFPDAGKASVLTERGGFFSAGWFNIESQSIVASLVFVSLLSVVETMLFDKRKGRGKKLIISVAFVVDVVINAIGWADFWGHSRRFEWFPLITLLRGQGPEWGSLLCLFAAILNAVMPEMMWEKARRARRAATIYKRQLKATKNQQGGGKERGMWLNTTNGMKWFTESELRGLQAKHAKRRGGR
jgi:hypothetical protein